MRGSKTRLGPRWQLCQTDVFGRAIFCSEIFDARETWNGKKPAAAIFPMLSMWAKLTTLILDFLHIVVSS
jgi:hypothetical protein